MKKFVIKVTEGENLGLYSIGQGQFGGIEIASKFETQQEAQDLIGTAPESITTVSKLEAEEIEETI